MIRKIDEISRYGGDEFILIHYNRNEKQALSVMEKVRQVVENMNLYMKK